MSLLASKNAGRLVLAAALMSGLLTTACSLSKPESITVGSIPDDYRTNHPIVIGERQRKLDLPVGQSDHRMTNFHRTAVTGFMANYDSDAAAPVTVILPRGSINEIAAANVADGVIRVIAGQGVPRHRIAIAAYHADPEEINAPIRITYAQMRASTGKCGRWPADIGETVQNKHYANFGCSYQNNLAAQIANPADLLGPRRSTSIDAENRGVAIDLYKNKDTVFDSEIDYNQ